MTAVLPAAQYRHGEDIGVEEDGSHEFKAFQTADPNGAGRFRAEGEICTNIVGECRACGSVKVPTSTSFVL